MEAVRAFSFSTRPSPVAVIPIAAMVVPLICLLVLITQAREAAAAGTCPNLKEMQAITVCYVTYLAPMPQCSEPWSREEVNHCMDRAARAYSPDPAKGLAILNAMMPPHRCYVPMVKSREPSYWVPTIVNRASGPVVLIDTGFTGSLQIPRSMIELLRSKGELTDLDRSGPPVITTLADGSEAIQETVIIREVILPGCRAFRDVRVIISPDGSDPLLGQGILSTFSSHGIDNKEHSLVLVP